MSSVKEHSDNEEGQAGTSTVSVKCRPNRLYKLIQKLNSAQRDAVERIGFGGLLHLNLRTYPLSHVPEFLEAFSDGSYVFRASKSTEFKVSKHDVYDCFMLPMGAREIEIVPTGHMPGSQDENHKGLKNRWRKKFNVKSTSDSIPLGTVFNHIENNCFQDGGDEFCRLFVLLAMSSFLTPTLNNGLEFKLLKAVEDVSAIPQYDWCSYVLECLVSAAAGHKVQSHMLGCIPFLMITYFQRFQFQRAICKHELPLIQYWDNKTLAGRIRGELDNGKLGGLKFSQVQYPRCLQKPSSSNTPAKRATVLAITCVGEPQPNMPLTPHVTPQKCLQIEGPPVVEDVVELNSRLGEPLLSFPPAVNVTSTKFIQIELPPGVEDDEELKARALDGAHELYLKIQRNAIAFYSWTLEATSKLQLLTSGASSSTGLAPSQATQQFFSDAKMKEYVDEVQQLATRMKVSVHNAPTLQQVRMPTNNEDKVGKDGHDVAADGGPTADDDDVGDKASDVITEQIMETANFYNTAELNEACMREQAEEEEGDAGDWSQLSDREILKEYYSVEEISIAMKDPETVGVLEEWAAEGGTPTKADDAGEKCVKVDVDETDINKVEVDNADAGQTTENDSTPFQFNDISSSDISNALRGLLEYGDVDSEDNSECDGYVDVVELGDKDIVMGVDEQLVEGEGNEFVSAKDVVQSGEKEVVVEVDEQVVGGNNTGGHNTQGFELTFYSESELKEAYKGVPDAGFTSVEQKCTPEPTVGEVNEVAEEVRGGINSQGFELTYYSTAELREAYKGVPDAGFSSVEDKSTPQPTVHVDNIVLSGGVEEVVQKEVGRPAVEGDKAHEEQLSMLSTPDRKDSVLGSTDAGSGLLDGPGPSNAEIVVPAIYVPRTQLIHHPFLLHSTEPLPCMDVVPENLGCSIDCGEPVPDQKFVSQLLQRNFNLFRTVFSLRKDVIDYVFNKSDDFPETENLVTYNEFWFITREDMGSLEPGLEIMSSVIDCWCLLLNQMMSEKTAAVATSRCFFGLNHTNNALDIWKGQKMGQVVDKTDDIFGCWDMWMDSCASPFQLDSDMVLIPVLSGDKDHYSCACLNFINEQIEYLDNRSYSDDFEKLPYGGIARIVANLMGKFMLTKGIKKGSKVDGFKLVNIPFSWQDTGYTRKDCGVYLMVHMLLYCGKPFQCDLGTKEAIHLYRAEIAATLVLSDINKARGDVLRRVAEFRKASSSGLSTKSRAGKRKYDVGINLSHSKRPRPSDPEDVSPPVMIDSVGSTSSQSLSAVKSRPRGGGDGLGCSLDCDSDGIDKEVVSLMVRNNKTLLKDVKPLRKHTVDYCLLDDYKLDIGETLVSMGRYATLTRDDILSMLPANIMSSRVIECWSMLLNKLESDENEIPRMAFFGIRHMGTIMNLLDTPEGGSQANAIHDQLFQIWDTFIKDCGNTFNLNAGLIFIPINMYGHFACVCINFEEETVDLLDHHQHSNWTTSRVCRSAHAIASAMSDYMDAKQDARGANITRFQERQIAFKRQTPSPNIPESGLFTMIYMLMYEGLPFEHPDLQKKVARRYLLVELVAALVLADINVEREVVLKSVKTFITDKDSIWARLQISRKIKEVLKRKHSSCQ